MDVRLGRQVASTAGVARVIWRQALDDGGRATAGSNGASRASEAPPIICILIQVEAVHQGGCTLQAGQGRSINCGGLQQGLEGQFGLFTAQGGPTMLQIVLQEVITNWKNWACIRALVAQKPYPTLP